MTAVNLNRSVMRGVMRAVVRASIRPILSPRLPASLQRRILGAITLINRPPRGVDIAPVDMHNVPALQVQPHGQEPQTAVLYLHGGGYVLGAPQGYRNVAGYLARSADAAVYTADYRLAPEHPFPAALDDAVSAYRWLLAQGYAPEKIAIAGDSAGGGLSVAAAVAIREQGLPMPGALLLISPWVDLTLSGETMHSNSRADPMLRQSWLQRAARQYMSDSPLDAPGGSPLFAELNDLPPMIIQSGQDEVLLSDSKRLSEHATAAGIAVTLQVYTGLWHVFQVHAGQLPESKAAIEALGKQFRQIIGNS